MVGGVSKILFSMIPWVLLFTLTSKTVCAAEQDENGDFDIEEIDSYIENNSGVSSSPEAKASEPVILEKLSNLVELTPFSDVVVIQRRFLPKTHRFEAYTAGLMQINDPFFKGFGGNLRFGFYFSEVIGLELNANIQSRSDREVIDQLKVRQVKTQSLVSPKSYYGLDFKWAPIYGKITFNNQNIVPYDLYFSLGGGVSQTTIDSSLSTVHLGVGQVFAASQWLAYRWDMSWNLFQSNSEKSGVESAVFLALGTSFFFPKSTYR